jgi:hypothetical protein
MASGGKKSGWLSSLINWFGVLTALVMVLHILFVLTGTAATNPFLTVVNKWAELLLLWWGSLFEPADLPLNIALNYAVAAVFWLLVTRIVARLLR